MIKRRLLYILFLISLSSFSQSIKDTSLFLPMFRLNYSFQVPGNDLADRYGLNSCIGFSFLAKTRSNFLFGYQFDVLFGNQIHEDGVLDSIKTKNGEIINRLGLFADVIMNERGFFTGPQIGYLYSFNKPNPNSGIYFLVSGGLLQHKINIQNKNQDAPQILDEYAKGYDRLTNGFALKETLAYMFFDNKSVFNFFAGVEFYQGFTQNRRALDFDLMVRDNRERLDLLVGFKVGWIITFQKRTVESFYYF